MSPIFLLTEAPVVAPMAGSAPAPVAAPATAPVPHPLLHDMVKDEDTDADWISPAKKWGFSDDSEFIGKSLKRNGEKNGLWFGLRFGDPLRLHAHEMMRKQCVSWPPLNKGVFVSQGNSALKDHPRLKHLLEAFKAKQEGQEKHNKASGDFLGGEDWFHKPWVLQ